MVLHGAQHAAFTSPSFDVWLVFCTLWSVLSIGYLFDAAIAFAFGTIGFRLESVCIVWWCGAWCRCLRSAPWDPVSDDA